MYQALLVDDEKGVTDFLKESIPWPSLGVDSVYTAADGLQALGVLANCHVDLLITDIQMPHMDGLELLRTVRKEYPNIHCIILTAYGEFTYAQQAIKLGIDNYLLKPIQMEELTETVESALESIYINRQNQNDLFRETILKRWVIGNISLDELSERAAMTDINIYLPQYVGVAFKKIAENVSLYESLSLISQQLKAYAYSSYVWDYSGHCILIIGAHSIDCDELYRSLGQCICSNNMNGALSAAIGYVVDDRMKLHLSCTSAIELLEKGRNEALSIAHAPSEQDSVSQLSLPDIVGTELSPVIKRAVDCIHERFSSGISVKEISAQLNMNTAYLGYLFKKEIGMFFNNYVCICRINEAMRLLRTTGDRVGDIAEKTGFTTTSHFITTFKKLTGLSPLKYRETYGG